MLRKISASEPVLGVIGTICVEAVAVAPSEDAAPETVEVPQEPVLPRPPVVVIDDGRDTDTFLGGGFSPPPVCPMPTLKTAFDPLTGTTRQYYDFGPGVTEVPAQCQIGAGVFF